MKTADALMAIGCWLAALSVNVVALATGSGLLAASGAGLAVLACWAMQDSSDEE